MSEFQHNLGELINEYDNGEWFRIEIVDCFFWFCNIDITFSIWISKLPEALFLSWRCAWRIFIDCCWVPTPVIEMQIVYLRHMIFTDWEVEGSKRNDHYSSWLGHMIQIFYTWVLSLVIWRSSWEFNWAPIWVFNCSMEYCRPICYYVKTFKWKLWFN